MGGNAPEGGNKEEKTPAAPVVDTKTPKAPEKGEPENMETDEKKERDYNSAASELAMGAALEKTITQIQEMGFPRDQVMKALKAAFNNPDRAVEYLMTGIPESANEPQQPQAATGDEGGQGAEESTPEQPFNMFAPETAPSSGQMPNNPLAALRNNPQFQTLRALVQQSPQLLQPMLQELGKNNPQLLAAINENQEQFLQILNEPLGPGEQNLAEMMSQMVSGEGGPGPQMVEVELTEEEAAAVDRLVALGFEKEACIEAFLVCGKNEEAAANFLLENS